MTTLNEIVEYAYAALDQTVADQTIELSIDFIRKNMPKEMTIEQVQDIISAALDTTENKRLNPKWFGDVIRNSKAGFNKGQEEVETSHPAPQSSGDFDLDTKCNFMTMWAVRYFATYYKEQYRLGCNWDIQYRFLVKHGLIDEPEGWQKTWREKAVESIKARILANGSIRDIIDSRHAVDAALQDNTDILMTMYKLRVMDLLERSQKLSPDEFSNRFNNKTPDTAQVYIIMDETKQHFHLTIN